MIVPKPVQLRILITASAMLLLLFSGWCAAQPSADNSPQLLWHRYYGHNQDDAAYSVRELENGDLALGGDCVLDSTGERQMCLMMISRDGELMWQKSYKGNKTASCRSLRPTNDGGFVLCGSTRGAGARGTDLYIVKTDGDGLEEWSRISQEAGGDFAETILHARGGGYVSAGRNTSREEAAVTGGFHLIKTNKPGKVVWTRNFVGERAHSIIEIDEGRLVAVGYTRTIPADARPPKRPRSERLPWEPETSGTDTSRCSEEAGWFVVKVDWKGETAWERTYWQSGWDVANAVAVAEDGGLFIVGEVGGCKYKPEWYDAHVIRTDVNGDTLWTSSFGGEREERAYAVIESEDGGCIVAGSTKSYGRGESDMLVFKLSRDGELEWSKVIGGQYSEVAHDIQRTRDGGYIIAGSTESFGAGGSDMYLVRLGKN